MKKILTDDIIKDIIEKYNNGISSRKIAKQLNIGATSVLRILEKNNISRECIKRKIIRENIENIIYLYESGESPTDIGKKYNVSQNAIWENLKNQM